MFLTPAGVHCNQWCSVLYCFLVWLPCCNFEFFLRENSSFLFNISILGLRGEFVFKCRFDWACYEQGLYNGPIWKHFKGLLFKAVSGLLFSSAVVIQRNIMTLNSPPCFHRSMWNKMSTCRIHFQEYCAAKLSKSICWSCCILDLL